MEPEQDPAAPREALVRNAAKLARAARKAAREAEPQARRIAGDAARAARPAAQRAAELARAHEAELRQAAALGARVAAARVVPPGFAPVVSAVADGFMTGVRPDPEEPRDVPGAQSAADPEPPTADPGEPLIF